MNNNLSMTPMRKLILASTSPYRCSLMERLGIPFTALPPRYEEQIDPSLGPTELVKQLAFGKAASLVPEHPGSIIIGSDQALESRGRIIGKPGSPERAREQLREMAGGVHTFYTGLAVIDTANDLKFSDCVPFTVTLRRLTETEIRDYVGKENPVDCAGSFKIEGLGIALMEKMEGDDYTALIGLPLISLTSILRRIGINPLLNDTGVLRR
jgi:septum formation protein